MDFALSKEHALLRQLYASFAENEIKPLAEEIDETERFPAETVAKCGQYGFMGVPFPKKYGGQGGDTLAYALMIEEISRHCAATATILAAHTSLCAGPIFMAGSEEQKQKYLPPLLRGEKLGAFGLTEAGAGSDASMQQTKARRDGDDYVLNGAKIFITNAGYADIYIIIAMTDKSKGNRGISAFIVERDAPGFSIGKKEKKMGIKGSSTCELIFEDCRIPAANLLGAEGQGFKIAMRTLDAGRIGVAAQGLGIAVGAFEESRKYTRERKQFGKRIAQFQNTQFELADMGSRIEACRLLVYKAACEKDAGREFNLYSSMAKYLCGGLGSDVTRRCLQLHGGYGYIREYPLERMMRDAKIIEIYEGTSEIQKVIVAGQLNVK
ncbi:MAG: acyl-CoA dehydrogenase [Peptococcaceae bacterium]|jgi:butyryl-CoA dehydrogenase|nr:acyl-CoA dehydrogenase [Peptococcaceae bacterium]